MGSFDQEINTAECAYALSLKIIIIIQEVSLRVNIELCCPGVYANIVFDAIFI